jgi:phosphoglycerol transferase MdoB-like AlkP superfamily enzyme
MDYSLKPIKNLFRKASLSYAKHIIILLSAFWLLSILEIFYNGVTHEFPKNLISVFGWSLVSNTIFWLKLIWWTILIFYLFYYLSPKFAEWFIKIFIAILFLVQLGLLKYFNTSLVPLGSDIFSYSFTDIKQTIGASGSLNFASILALFCLSTILYFTLKYLPNKIKLPYWLAISLPIFSSIFLFFDLGKEIKPKPYASDYTNNLILNKSDYFFSSAFNFFYGTENETDIYADSYIGDYLSGQSKTTQFEYLDPNNYPFLHKKIQNDVLGPFIKPTKTTPNIVIVVVEGLGRAFTNDEAYLGNFTPFLDSLSNESLYWKNFLSEGGRTFAILPSLMGSLPFGTNGFLEMGDKMPNHISLYSLLKYNGYHTSFYYGGDAEFDNMALFLRKNKVDKIADGASFPAGYKKLPATNGFSWGYNDKELFRNYLTNNTLTSPQLSVILTVSSHNPFIINEEDHYLKTFENRMTELGFDESTKKTYRNYQLQYASIMYVDDAIKGFFNAYKKRPDFKNTIFLITGDHRMPEIPLSSQIDRYHVPLIIYSSLLKRSAKFSSISTHFDITPSILAYLANNHQIKLPDTQSWLGDGLDTTRNFQNIHSYPLIQTKTDLVDFIMGEYHLNKNSLYKMLPNMDEVPVDDEKKMDQLKYAFKQFKKRNAEITDGKLLLPNNIYQKFEPK